VRRRDHPVGSTLLYRLLYVRGSGDSNDNAVTDEPARLI